MDWPFSERVSWFLTLPIGAIGTFLIMDDGGPPGSLGFAEYFGWWTICFVVAWFSAKLASAFELDGRRHLAFAPAVVLPVLLALLLYVDVRPTTPAGIKNSVEYGQQAIGLIAIAGFVGWLVKSAWSKIRRSNAI